MKTQITHHCGHIREYTLHKKNAGRWLARKDCPDCELRLAAQFERINSLPPLTGSQKQINWATQIRCRIINDLNRMRSKIPAHMRNHPKALDFDRLLTACRSCTSSRAWIDRADFKVTSETIKAILTKQTWNFKSQ